MALTKENLKIDLLSSDLKRLQTWVEIEWNCVQDAVKVFLYVENFKKILCFNWNMQIIVITSGSEMI